MTPDERQDLNEFLAELYTTIRRHEEALAPGRLARAVAEHDVRSSGAARDEQRREPDHR